ncbi:protein-export membrane protein, SecD/SecF family [Acetomicrobium mobile DSM 13181]|uniref:Protein-export membrane protein SecF n=1 Tax=Acetomicrobium mobile (strain ATCC BAA-54 / DSM 13181 / JCM 12221 / NGA) TaxID=891968 RepID=I4BUY8_ACEMN|nr:protein translocase subunit SecF [Acetomicrobium mobile]AFM21095.1 protein-export membrane protein, SecD/SecF family [Acetomicrobium mobile DSM 13181]
MFIKLKTNINFMKYRRLALLGSALLVLLSLVLLITRGLNFGIDFTGGMLLQLEFDSPVSVAEVRGSLDKIGFGGSVIQAYSEKGVLIRLKTDQESDQKKIVNSLRESLGKNVKVLRTEVVGPVAGSQLRRSAILATSLALLAMLAYITFRFQFRFAVGGVVALVHDVIITLGIFSITYHEVSMPFIAGMLTLVGYSINDTIVVFDRVRENFKNLKQWGMVDLFNNSINQVLSRTINTSLTTLFPVITLFLWGGEVISDFSMALLIGIIVGTYSSIYIAGAMVVEWYLRSPHEAGKLQKR